MSLDQLKPYRHALRALEIKPTTRILLVSIVDQRLDCLENERPVRSIAVSTSLKPPSNQQDSGGTPRGLHRIAQKIGAAAPLGVVFKGRINVGQRYWEMSEEEQKRNLITSRILWLKGLEADVNSGDGCDSFARYIYIHGTNHEDKIGSPASGGCVQLRNQEMIELFDTVAEGDHVWIG